MIDDDDDDDVLGESSDGVVIKNLILLCLDIFFISIISMMSS